MPLRVFVIGTEYMTHRALLKMANTTFGRSIIAAILLCCLNAEALAQPTQAASKNNETVCRAAVTALLASYESFPFSRCRYRTTFAKAHTAIDAWDGKIYDAESCDALHLRDGNVEKLECDADPSPESRKAVKGKDGRRLVYTSFVTRRFLADREHGELSFPPVLKAINLRSPEKVQGPTHATPFLYGFQIHLGRSLIESKLTDQVTYRAYFDGVQVLNDRPVVNLRLEGNVGNRFCQWLYCLDPEHGYLPIRHTESINKRIHIDNRITRWRECSKGRWFPGEMISVSRLSEGPPYNVVRLQILELDVDRRPATDEFSIEVPAGTQVCGTEAGRGHFYLKQDERIHVSDLPRMFDRLARAKSDTVMDTDIAATRAHWWHWRRGGRWLALGAAVLLLGVTSRISRRRVRGVRS
jgi:hypothetical protein